MCFLYYCFQKASRFWFWFIVTPVILTIGYGYSGFVQEDLKEKEVSESQTVLYRILLLFTLNADEVGKDVNGDLDVARWCGALVWFSTVLTVLIRMFAQTATIYWIYFWTLFPWRRHIVVAGLGEPEDERDRLVEKLRKNWENVVVIETNPAHPGLQACRRAGALCLIGSPFEPIMMELARLKRASGLLALSREDRKNVMLLGLAAKIVNGNDDIGQLQGEDEDVLARSNKKNLRCVIQVGEPRLLEVLARHKLHRDSTDRLHVRLFSMHEMVARAMLREHLIGRNRHRLDKILLLGTGGDGKLGASLAIRAIKDRWIESDKLHEFKPLQIHVYDPSATDWVDCVRGAMRPEMENLCRFYPHDCHAPRRGFRSRLKRMDLVTEDFDAVFICMGHESRALIQASDLRDVLPEKVPIVVRVPEESAGFGRLLRMYDAGGLGPNLSAVGTHERLWHIAATMNPGVEMLAQVLHQDYLSMTQGRLARAVESEPDKVQHLLDKAAFRPWSRLRDTYREMNRHFAEGLRDFLTIPASEGKPARVYRRVFSPSELIDPQKTFHLEKQEIERLAKRQHSQWVCNMRRRGWKRGAGDDADKTDQARKLHRDLRPWDDLHESSREYTRTIIRRLPIILAKADYRLVLSDESSTRSS